MKNILGLLVIFNLFSHSFKIFVIKMYYFIKFIILLYFIKASLCFYMSHSSVPSVSKTSWYRVVLNVCWIELNYKVLDI